MRGKTALSWTALAVLDWLSYELRGERSGESSRAELTQEVLHRRWSVVVVGPEFFQDPSFDVSARKTRFYDSLFMLDIDEAHTLYTEGTTFREAMHHIPDMLFRSRRRLLVVLKTATLTRAAEAYLRRTFHLSPLPAALHVVLASNNRPQVKWLVHYLFRTPSGASPPTTRLRPRLGLQRWRFRFRRRPDPSRRPISPS
ncbi:hypothetical protein JCM8547_006057 [Rhodosporidiobolus lusitaniae]